MNLLTLFFGIVAVIIATVSIFFDNVEASASADALAAPDALADAKALPRALPRGGGYRVRHDDLEIPDGVYNPQSPGLDVGKLSDDIFIQAARREFQEAVRQEQREKARRRG
uniref:Venom peptide n=1 Tax=Dasymutilla chiron TaxID=374949 RepID=A0A8T9VPM4_DASCH|nr:venom peptide precursor [Dasymutilla chiron]